MRARLIFPLTAALAAGACATTTGPDAAPGTYLEIEYVNFAWVPTWQGLVIDSTGTVHRFDLEGARWSADGDAYVSAEALADKWQRNRTVHDGIGSGTFAELAALLGAADGTLSSPQGGCADAGVITYSGYRYHPGRDAFERIVVRREGDIAQLSTSEAGRALARRLVALALRPTIPDCEP